MAANCGRGRGLCADAVAVDEESLRTAAARKEKGEEERMLLWEAEADV